MESEEKRLKENELRYAEKIKALSHQLEQLTAKNIQNCKNAAVYEAKAAKYDKLLPEFQSLSLKCDQLESQAQTAHICSEKMHEMEIQNKVSLIHFRRLYLKWNTNRTSYSTIWKKNRSNFASPQKILTNSGLPTKS